MPKTIDIPGHGPVDFPDSMTDDQITAAIRKLPGVAQPDPSASWYANMGANSLLKGLATIPDSVLNTPNRILNLGKAAIGSAANALGHPDLAPATTEDPNFVNRAAKWAGIIKPEFDPKTPGQRMADMVLQGGAGAMAGGPASSVRQWATNGALGAAGGGAAGATKEVTGDDNMAMLAGMGAVPVALGAVGAGQRAVQAQALRQSQNAVRDKTIADAHAAGYVLSPSETNPGVLNHALEGTAGKLSTRQLASTRNQPTTNDLARQAVELPEGTALSSGVLQNVRKQAYKDGYEPIASAGDIMPGRLYRTALDDITAKYKNASNSFPGAVKDDVTAAIDALRVKKFDAGDALSMTQILRDEASQAFRNGDTGLGGAKRAAAKAIEDQIERSLQTPGQPSDLLPNFRDARALMAKAHTVEDALHEGSGNVQASKLAQRLQAGKPLSDELRTIGMTADAFPKNMQSPEVFGASPGFSPLDYMASTGLGVAGAAMSGSPYGAAAAALPAVRPLAREALLSAPYQNRMLQPEYSASPLARFLAKGDVKRPDATAAMIAAILANKDNQENQ